MPLRPGRSRRQILFILAGVLAFSALLPFVLPPLRWRTGVIAMKMRGELIGATWSDVLSAVSHQPSLSVAELLRERNLYKLVRNPHDTPADAEQGRDLFRTRCAACHGVDARGLSAPDLTGSLRSGGSDWALYRTIREGVPGTAMRGLDLPEDSLWRLVSFVQSLQRGTESPSPNNPAVHIAPASGVTYSRLVSARSEPGNWLTYSGAYDGRRHSSLARIDRSNIERLELRWLFQIPTEVRRIETTPIVVDGVMYVSEPGSVTALDAATGEVFWTHRRNHANDVRACCGPVNRGVAVLGNRVYVGTLDAHVVALDAATGELVWEVPVADYRRGYSITSAPLALEDRVIIGVGGGDFATRGFLDAYFAETGERAWRFYTVPGPGEPAHETWAGDSWMTGGAATWMTGSFDPDLNLIYWGVGNPGPAFNGDDRGGDNLYSNSIVAVDAATGALRWHFQFTPHDVHDWDATQVPVLIDAIYGDDSRRLLALANRNAFFYLLDRETGEFLLAREFARQTWAHGIDRAGRPTRRAATEPSPEGTLVSPALFGATNWWSPSYSPVSGLFYIPTIPESAGIYFSGPVEVQPGEKFLGSAAQGAYTELQPTIRALDPLTGELRWEYPFPTSFGRSFPGMGGVLTTGGQLAFAGAANVFVGLDAESGEELWRFNPGGSVAAGPIAYLANESQFIAVAAGRSIVAFALAGD